MADEQVQDVNAQQENNKEEPKVPSSDGANNANQGPKDDKKPVSKIPKSVLIAERNKFRERESRLQSELQSLEKKIEALENQRRIPPSDVDKFISENPDDPLVKKILAQDQRVNELEAKQTARDEALSKLKQAEIQREAANISQNLKTKYSHLPIWEAQGEDGPKIAEFGEWLDQEGNEWAATSSEMVEKAFKLFFEEEILNTRVKSLAEEKEKRQQRAASERVPKTPQGGQSSISSKSNPSFADGVREMLAAKAKAG